MTSIDLCQQIVGTSAALMSIWCTTHHSRAAGNASQWLKLFLSFCTQKQSTGWKVGFERWKSQKLHFSSWICNSWLSGVDKQPCQPLQICCGYSVPWHSECHFLPVIFSSSAVFSEYRFGLFVHFCHELPMPSKYKDNSFFLWKCIAFPVCCRAIGMMSKQLYISVFVFLHWTITTDVNFVAQWWTYIALSPYCSSNQF